jgi:hypothetical protein
MPALNIQNANAERVLRVQSALQRVARENHRSMTLEEQEVFDACERRLVILRAENSRNYDSHPEYRVRALDVEITAEQAFDATRRVR